jgi:excisionase family DNA binding protein
MSEPTQNPFDALLDAFRTVVREEIKAAFNGNGNGYGAELFTPEELAERIRLPVSWVYEQSRQGNIPTHKIGRYLRFNLTEVLESQKKKKEAP